MRILVVAVAFLACVALTGASEKESACCRQVSTKKITVPITGFSVQQPKPPCVKAVIFYTEAGAMCSHWKETWVMKKVQELRLLQTMEKNQKMNTTTIAPQTTVFTDTLNATLYNSTTLA